MELPLMVPQTLNMRTDFSRVTSTLICPDVIQKKSISNFSEIRTSITPVEENLICAD